MAPPPRRRRWRALAILFSAALLALVIGLYAYQATASRPGLQHIAVPLLRGNVVSTISASGNVRPVSIVRVSTLQGGTLVRIPVDFNSDVHKGDLLAQIDDVAQRSELRRATAEVAVAAAQQRVEEALVVQRSAEIAAAQAQYESMLAAAGASRGDLDVAAAAVVRQEALLKNGVATEVAALNARAARDTARAKLEQADSTVRHAKASREAAEAALLAVRAQQESSVATLAQATARQQRARIDLDRTRILSPVDGTVVWKSVDVGQTVSTNVDPPVLFFIAQDLTEVQIETTIDENDISHVRVGQTVSFTVAAYPGEQFQGAVKQIRTGSEALFGSKQGTVSAVTYIVEIATANKDRRLLPGMTASVRIVTAQAQDQLTVPAAALRFGERFVAKNAVQMPNRPGLRPLLLIDEANNSRVIAVRLLASDGVSTAVETGAAWTINDRVIVAERPVHER
ncbi:efflux RND transporter periplasmic adaptor subunit [Bradyrhizobium sp. CCGUVB1N3]|uniref:efflux RND transporter periplasmic adaptor subunit n=1 Tax=Bradyrhizobium sp. CCGUVB1N3 TaxID=2949629 RepID=UPI0020B2E43F|nr:efflux RND transporter periplasmic adaptor subunit [Bradyrhizobium sp. CCGUVB1N3]MCP3476209.1 efflux RND transporter periplasmic adaptor subunit [Bradyrhizobium sp. CCGUVB1N3]